MPQHVLAESFDDFVVSEVLRNLVVAIVLVVFVKLLESSSAPMRCSLVRRIFLKNDRMVTMSGFVASVQRIPVSHRHSTLAILPGTTSISNGPHGRGNRCSANKMT